MAARIKSINWPSEMPEDEWEKVAQEIPSKEEPFIGKYISGREALIAEEKKQRSGRFIPHLPLTVLFHVSHN
jgi:adenosine deaminase CECR1